MSFRLSIFTTLSLLLVGVGVLMTAPVDLVRAQDSYGLDKAQSATKDALPKTVAGNSTVPQIIGLVLQIALQFLGILFFGLVLFAGIYWMIALGDSGKVDKAKEILQAAIIGLLIVLGAYAITSFVFEKLVQREGGGERVSQSTG